MVSAEQARENQRLAAQRFIASAGKDAFDEKVLLGSINKARRFGSASQKSNIPNQLQKLNRF